MLKNDKYLNRIGQTNYNNQGCLMKIIEYKSATDIIVEFQDEYHYRIRTWYDNFKKGAIKNPYAPAVFNMGRVGIKYKTTTDRKTTKEYNAWTNMLNRCYSVEFQNKNQAYIGCSVSEEWLLFESYYEWLHSQPNYDKWSGDEKWCVDKDILLKGNKMYSPKTCCLVPDYVNTLFVKKDASRGNLPIGVCIHKDGFQACCSNPLLNKYVYLGIYDSSERAFQAYKKYKENLIKQIAEIEYDKGNITKQCYDAMMNYQVEITD